MKTVVLLQGFPEAFLSKKTLIHSYFEDNKYRIVLPDLNSESLFDSEFVLSDVESKLDGKSPDVIVGVSMGGLLAPVLANRYPKSKLVLVATGPYFKTKISAYNLLVALEARDKKTILIRILRLIPRGLFRFAYKNFNRSSTISDVEYAQRADENFDGVIGELNRRYLDATGEWALMEIQKYMREEICPQCHGAKLKKEILSVTINKKNISDISNSPVDFLQNYFNDSLSQLLTDYENVSLNLFGKDYKIIRARKLFQVVLRRLRGCCRGWPQRTETSRLQTRPLKEMR